jgi:diguanylate cyclase (GGDEF)-like protein
MRKMKKAEPIQRQVYYILTAILAGFMLISIASTYLFFWPALTRQDYEHAITNSLRVYKLFRDESNNIKRIVSDWAVWDDSYKFIQDGNDEYIQSNLAANTFSNLAINDIMYIHNDGRLRWAGSITPDHTNIEPIDKNMVHAAHRMFILGLQTESGILKTGDLLFLIDISEVTDSAEELDPVGVIAMTRKIDESYLMKKRDQLQINFALTNINMSGAPGVWTDNNKAITDSFVTVKENDDLLVTFNLPLLEQGSVSVEVRTPRHVMLEAKKLLIWNGSAVLLAALLLLWSINLLLKKRIISPLQNISNQVNRFEEQSQGGLRLDYTESLELEQISDAIVSMHTRIMQIATHDHLTGLPNRRLLDERLRHAEARALRQGKSFAVLCIDLDGFKPVNDTYGHDIGDLVLKTIAKRLLAILRVTDTVARVGGDEFIVLLDPGYQEKSETEVICQRLINEIEKPLLVEKVCCTVSASIGAAISPYDSKDIAVILKLADNALYEAKSAGKATYRFSKPSN